MKNLLGRSLLGRLWRDECGFIVSAELAVIATSGVLATVVGLHAVAGAVNHELNDVSNAIGALDQSYSYNGFCHPGHSWVAGSAYLDTQDDCDCMVIGEVTPRPKFDGSGQNRDHRDAHRRKDARHQDTHHRSGDRKKIKGKGGKKRSDKGRSHSTHDHGHHDHRGNSTHGRTIILKAENGRPIFINEQGCPIHPRCQLPCSVCRKAAGRRTPTELEPVPEKKHKQKMKNKKQKRDKRKKK